MQLAARKEQIFFHAHKINKHEESCAKSKIEIEVLDNVDISVINSETDFSLGKHLVYWNHLVISLFLSSAMKSSANRHILSMFSFSVLFKAPYCVRIRSDNQFNRACA